MTVDPGRTAARRAKRRRAVGEGAICLICSEATPEALTRVCRTLLEAHHVAGERNDADLTVPLCLNCHRVVTEGQLAAGIVLRARARPHPIHQLIDWLIGLADFLERLSASARSHALKLRDLVSWLNATHPGWDIDSTSCPTESA